MNNPTPIVGTFDIVLADMHLLSLETRDGQQSINVVRELTQAEGLRFAAAVKHLAEYHHSLSILPIVAANAEELARFIRAVLATPIADLKQGEWRRAAAAEVNRLLLNYLSATKLFLEHSQTRLSRRYGAESPQLKAFKGATRKAFDCIPEYRICYKLRNYIQHVGLPVENIGLSTSLVSITSNDVRHTVSVCCTVQMLLDTYGEWGKAADDLRDRAPELHLAQLIGPFTDALHDIDEAVRSAEERALRKSTKCIFDLYGEVQTPSSTAAVARLKPIENGMNIAFVEPPPDILARMRSAARDSQDGA